MVKIGLIAPFEGPSRSLGYSVLHAVQIQMQAWNESNATPKVELVALNDDSDPAIAARLSAQLAVDPDIAIVLGPPQAHTAEAAVATLAEHHLPTLTLAPIPNRPPDSILPFAGVDETLLDALTPHIGDAVIARHAPVSGPSVWLGDPYTLAQLLHSDSAPLIAASGPQAAETSFVAWADAAADGLLWASAYPADLPPEFLATYQQRTGAPPTPTAALAYAATAQALHLLQDTHDRAALVEKLNTLRDALPPISVFRRQGDACCVLIPPPQ